MSGGNTAESSAGKNFGDCRIDAFGAVTVILSVELFSELSPLAITLRVTVAFGRIKVSVSNLRSC